ncbi:actin-5c-related [Anaeramoeba flamelloides]|uniref:Actin-5c-related n=1 Tax=Anaeramoeba flamelloides TaxID=1746091 RepID=A0AAV8A4Y6_9EUKA|nr:actin-5c-related [Anaeramoeba flamelloides]|eukprot:Anaeramoba_flamelloidesa1058027_154.p1 GENE.a1058027_154~~a1058027_154.p1  ORF type:complete len:266 (-),score=75.28 a1058027_154:261-1058(-)
MSKVVIDLGTYSFKFAFGTKTYSFEPQEIKCSEYGDPYNGKEITDLVGFKKMINKIFETLEVKPNTCQVVVSVHVHEPYQLDELLANYFFNELNVQGFFIAVQPVLSMYSCGKLDGLVVELGKNYVQIVPGRKGWAVIDAIKVAKISENFEIETITNLIQESINSIKESSHEILLQNIVIAGFNANEEFEDTLEKKLNEIYTDKKIHIMGVEKKKMGRQNSALIGGCILSVQETFNTMWITKEKYQEKGQEVLKAVYTVPEEAKF